ncbi:MAG: 3-dehydroquinate synthase [Armatimonadota bacterium]|nr:3-dehydroquinate synthase [Armatimonadota bacterium]MDR7444391.1 3-dehydroquinate synthase [Armatimonadota bacterium]MDR7570747.1 3-dehydroquinate synthase [Armatimonadota bacterium]MDR7614877.1 3-dehydroquinate synthase [Armatimonadota bacterium]
MRNIALIGFMGSGKTSVGRELARRLGWPFVDTDELVERRTGRSVPEIFVQDGEAAFRALEREAVREAARMRPAVIACGGGVPMDSANVRELRRTCRLVLLEADLETVLARVGGGEHRPLLHGDPEGRARQLLLERAPRYREVADLVVDTSGLTVTVAAERILEGIANQERHTLEVVLPDHRYPVHVGDGILPLVALDLLRTGVRRAALVTHPHLLRRYGEGLVASLRAWGMELYPVPVPSGERSKTLSAARRVYEAMAAARLDRASGLLALGGGVVGDLGGFVAATYMRGIPLFLLPTTLLAQVDASIGGKTALNLTARNLIGAFWQPVAVLSDVATLRSLPRRELRAGLAEAIKHAAIADGELFAWLEGHLPEVLRRNPETLAELVTRNVAIKARFVTADERETAGAREALNFGHTVAHALEAALEYRISHGEAVAQGMVVEARLAVRLGLLGDEEAARLEALIARVGLPTRLPPIAVDDLLDRMFLDKKVRHGRLRFALLEGIGRVRTGVAVEPELVRETLQELRR